MTLSNPSAGHDLALPDGEPIWTEVYNGTDTVLISIERPIHAMGMIADEHPRIGGPERQTAALIEVMRAPKEKNERLKGLRPEEYRAGLALREAGLSAAIRRGK